MRKKKLNSAQNTLNTLSLFGIVSHIGIGVNAEGLTRVIPSSFSKEVGKKKYILLMKVTPNYKLPSFRFGVMEVVTAAAHAVVASFLVTKTSFLKKIPLLKAFFNSIAPGWTDALKNSLNTAGSQPVVIGRMVYGTLHVFKHPNFFFNKSCSMTILCAATLS